MLKRFIIVVGLLLLFVAAIGFYKYRQISKLIAMASNWEMPPTAVTAVTVHKTDWPKSLRAVGSTEAINGVTMSADLPGVVAQINFESGRPVKKGDILVQLLTDEEQAQLSAAEAKRDLAVISLQREQNLLKTKTASQSEFDAAEGNYRETQANVEQCKATIARKVIRAPFDGLLGIRRINLGQYLNSGDAIVPLHALNPINVNFSLPQQNYQQVHSGSVVIVTSDALKGEEFRGEVTAVNPQIDSATRNFQIQATFENKEGKLRPGMFVDAQVQLPEKDSIYPVPATAIKYAPYGDSVFVVKDLKNKKGKSYQGVEQKYIELGASKGDLVSISSGLDEGSTVVTSGVFRLENGTAVKINNTVQPADDLQPKPTDS